MKRDILLFIEDILESINDIEEFSKDLTQNKFFSNKEKQNAIVRSLEIIGEAAKNVPEDFRIKYPNIEWQKVSGLRDVLIHAYFVTDLLRVWKVVKEDLPKLKKEIRKILKKEREK